MNTNPIIAELPQKIRDFIAEAPLTDCSGMSGDKTFYINKGNGYYLKISKKSSLENERLMTEYFNRRNLAARVELYVSEDRDYLITTKVQGENAFVAGLSEPERLCQILAISLRKLHDSDAFDCPIIDKTKTFIRQFMDNTNKKLWDDSEVEFLLKLGFSDKDSAYDYFALRAYTLEDNALIHGDACLPNCILENYQLSGYVDLGLAGIGDRHYDLFWTLWSLAFNSKKRYTDLFLDTYGRHDVDLEKIKLWGIHSAFNTRFC